MPLVHTHLLNSFRVIYPATSQHSFLKLINKDTVRDFLNAWREKKMHQASDTSLVRQIPNQLV